MLGEAKLAALAKTPREEAFRKASSSSIAASKKKRKLSWHRRWRKTADIVMAA